MKLGKDFKIIVWLIRFVLELLERLGKEQNEDTPNGEY